MRYSDRLDFEFTHMPSIRVKRLIIHNTDGGSRRQTKRHDVYMEVPGMLRDRLTGQRQRHTLTVFLGVLEGRNPSWRPDPGLRAWMERRGHVRRKTWQDLESLQWEIRRLARWDHTGAVREAMEAIQETTSGDGE